MRRRGGSNLKQLGDQALHLAIGAILVSPWLLLGVSASWWPYALAGALSGLWAAALREYEQRPVERWWDLVLDVGVMTLGAAGAGLGLWALRG